LSVASLRNGAMPTCERAQQVDDAAAKRIRRARPGGRLLLIGHKAEPSALLLDDSTCYHFRILDPRVFATLAAATIGHCYHI
jgi:hypothetical protein